MNNQSGSWFKLQSGFFCQTQQKNSEFSGIADPVQFFSLMFDPCSWKTWGQSIKIIRILNKQSLSKNFCSFFFVSIGIIYPCCGSNIFSNPDLTIKSTCDSGKVSRPARTNPLDKTISPSQLGVMIWIFTGVNSGILYIYSRMDDSRCCRVQK